MIINVGRASSGGKFEGLFGNPVIERTVSAERYRKHFRSVMKSHPNRVAWLKRQLKKGAKMYCPGCGIGSRTCHARIIEQELGVG